MIDWSPLRAALADMRRNNIALPIWWRDDDVIKPTAHLDQLSGLAEALDMPVYLAVIPAHAKDAVAPAIVDHPNLHAVVHGWAHLNTAPEGYKKSEFGVVRGDATADASAAMARMKALFADHFVSLFVPPWNRIDKAFIPQLGPLGYAGFSTFGPRKGDVPLPQINTHIDPIFWRGHRGLLPPDQIISQTVEILEARISGTQDADEPLGYLTHHLVHDPDIWGFSRAFLTELLNGGAICADIRAHLARANP